VKDLDIAKPALGHQLTREFDRLLAPLDADDGSGRADALRERVEAAVRTTADLHDAGTVKRPNLIEQPGRFVRELRRLALQPMLFGVSISRQ